MGGAVGLGVLQDQCFGVQLLICLFVWRCGVLRCTLMPCCASGMKWGGGCSMVGPRRQWTGQHDTR